VVAGEWVVGGDLVCAALLRSPCLVAGERVGRAGILLPIMYGVSQVGFVVCEVSAGGGIGHTSRLWGWTTRGRGHGSGGR